MAKHNEHTLHCKNAEYLTTAQIYYAILSNNLAMFYLTYFLLHWPSRHILAQSAHRNKSYGTKILYTQCVMIITTHNSGSHKYMMCFETQSCKRKYCYSLPYAHMSRHTNGKLMSPGKSLQQTLQPNKYTVYTTSIGQLYTGNELFVLSQHYTHMYSARSPATTARRFGTWSN